MFTIIHACQQTYRWKVKVVSERRQVLVNPIGAVDGVSRSRIRVYK